MNSLITSPTRRGSAPAHQQTTKRQQQPATITKAKFKKAPQAPRRFKSAYMFYSTWKHKDIRERLSQQQKKIQTPEVAKMVSRSWKKLSALERAPWDEMARKDKARFQLEKSLYDGPWKVLDVKDPFAPKRPVSAFLLFSKAKRDLVKRDGRHRTTTEISTVLSKMWKTASEEERQVYIKRDLEDRQRYKRELYEYQLIASDGRREREARAVQAVADNEEEDDNSYNHRRRQAGTAVDGDEQREDRDETELSRLIRPVMEPVQCKSGGGGCTDDLPLLVVEQQLQHRQLLPPPQLHRSESASPGVNFAAQWTNDGVVGAPSPTRSVSGITGDSSSSSCPMRQQRRRPLDDVLSVEATAGSSPRDDPTVEQQQHQQQDHRNRRRRGDDRSLTPNDDLFFDDFTKSPHIGAQPTNPSTFRLPPPSNTTNTDSNNTTTTTTTTTTTIWDPIPLDEPVAEFDHNSCSSIGCYEDVDVDDDFDVSPIATRSIMDDNNNNNGGYHPLHPVITPPRLSVAPEMLIDTNHYRMPSSTTTYYPLHHRQHQQQSWQDNNSGPRYYRHPSYRGYGVLPLPPPPRGNDATTTAVPSSSPSYDVYHQYNHHVYHQAYNPISSSIPQHTSSPAICMRTHRRSSDGDDHDGNQHNDGDNNNHNKIQQPGSVDYPGNSIYPV